MKKIFFVLAALVSLPLLVSAFVGSPYFDVSGSCSYTATCGVTYGGGEDGTASVDICGPSGCQPFSGWKQVERGTLSI